MHAMQPSRGARMILRRGAPSPDQVRYAVELELVEGTLSGEVWVRLSDGETRFAPWSPAEPPDWAAERIRALLHAEWRTRRTSGGWPRRFTRWRDEPEKVA